MTSSQKTDPLTLRMESMIEKLLERSPRQQSRNDPPELTEALGVISSGEKRPLPIPDSVLRELLQNHLDHATDDIMQGFESAIERMNQGLREAQEAHFNLTRRQMRESLRDVLFRVSRSTPSSS